MRFSLFPTISAVVMAGVLAGLTGSAQAEVTWNAGARLSHDNNVNGSPTKANRLSDNSLTLSASGVYFTPLNDAQTNYFIGQIGALSTDYNKYHNLNSSMLVASVGLWKQLSATWSGQVTGRAFTRDTQQDDRDSNGYGATLEIKDQLTKTVWLKGVADYEDSKAHLSTFSNSGPTYGVNLGYLPFKDTFINLGYSHATRDFKTVTSFVSESQTLFLEGTQRLAKNWYLSVGYAYQDNNSNIAGTAYTNQTVSVGLNFSY
jgi:hypothetical protein